MSDEYDWDGVRKASQAGVLKKITSIAMVNDERVVILFEDGTQLVGTVYGECCSSTWVEHLTVPGKIVGATFYAIENSGEVEDGEPDNADNWDEKIAVYHTSIRTSAGEVIIEYRNSSNGYYGGSLQWSVK